MIAIHAADSRGLLLVLYIVSKSEEKEFALAASIPLKHSIPVTCRRALKGAGGTVGINYDCL